jgi:hypothetical protein
MGPLELRFRLEVSAGALRYHPAGAALRWGALRLPLPQGCTPRVSAREEPLGGPDQTSVAVEVNLPLLGLLIAYEGTMTLAESSI